MRKVIDFIELSFCLALSYPTHWKYTIKKVRKLQYEANEKREIDKRIKRESKMLRNTKV